MKYKILLTKKVKRAKIKMQSILIFLVKVYFWVEVYLFALHTNFYKRYGLNCVKSKQKHTIIGFVLLCSRYFFMRGVS